MKSQDIFLLLKLVALENQSNAASEQAGGASGMNAQDWRDWSEEDDDQLPPPVRRSTGPLQEPLSVRGLSATTGLSKSEVGNSLTRSYRSGLAKQSHEHLLPVVNTKGLLEFLVYGVRYVFPAAIQSTARGIATGLTAPVFKGELRAVGNGEALIWPDPQGNTAGPAIEPLYKTVTFAVRKDPALYALLALVDSIRIGQPRERALAVQRLEGMLRGRHAKS